MNATDTPRIQVIKQGSTYNAQTELIRLGDLNGNWGYVAAKYGLSIGEYLATKANILLDEDGVLRSRNFSTTIVSLGADGLFELVGTMKVSGSITAASSAVVINTIGIQVDKSAGASAATINSYKFMSSGAEWGGVYAYSETLELSQKSIAGQSGVIRIRQQSPSGQLSSIILENIINGVVTSRINMGRASGTLDAITMEADVINFQEALQQYGGTSFPASPSNGDKYYRTDRNLLYFYQTSTTEWLTCEIFTASLVDVSNLPPYGAATFATKKPTLIYEIPTHTYAARVVSTKFLVLTGATNDGTKYWTYRVRHQNNSGGSFTDLIALANTSAVAANTCVSVATTAASIPQAADGSIVALWLQAVGTTPSNVTFCGTIQYRSVG